MANTTRLHPRAVGAARELRLALERDFGVRANRVAVAVVLVAAADAVVAVAAAAAAAVVVAAAVAAAARWVR